MRKINVDDVRLDEFVAIIKQYYPSFKWSRSKKGVCYHCSMDTYGKGKYKWIADTRDEFIFIMSGLIAGAEYFNEV